MASFIGWTVGPSKAATWGVCGTDTGALLSYPVPASLGSVPYLQMEKLSREAEGLGQLSVVPSHTKW